MPARPRYARTLRDSFMRPRAAWGRGTLGALPRENHGDRRDKAAQIFRARQGVKAKAYWRYVEPQTMRHCAKRQAVLARRPPRFSRPGREVRFLHLLVFTQSHAAELARPRYARTLRDSFVCCGAWVRGTLGALPRENHGDRRDKAAQIFRARQGVKAKAYWRYVEPQTTRHCAKRQAVLARRPPRFSRPRQEPEVPAPPTFLPPACVRSYEPFHAAIDAESASPASKYNSAKSPAYPRPPSASGIPLRPARSAGT